MRVVKLLNQLGQLMVVEAIALAGSRGIAAVGGNPLLTVPIGVGIGRRVQHPHLLELET